MDNAGGDSSSGEESSSDDGNGERRPALKESDKRELEGIGGEGGNQDFGGKVCYTRVCGGQALLRFFPS